MEERGVGVAVFPDWVTDEWSCCHRDRDPVRRRAFQWWREVILSMLDSVSLWYIQIDIFIQQLEPQPDCSAEAQEIYWMVMLRWVYINASLWKLDQCKIKLFPLKDVDFGTSLTGTFRVFYRYFNSKFIKSYKSKKLTLDLNPS